MIHGFIIFWILTTFLIMPEGAISDNKNILAVSGNQILYKGNPIKLIGLRCSNALVSDKTTDDLVSSLDLYKSYGINTLSIYIMGSRFGDVAGYLPDGSLDPAYSKRLERILLSTGEKEMIVIVGCLYWGTSNAKKELEFWDRKHAETAIKNTARWLMKKKFGHVILDPDNEGMAVSEKGWDIGSLIRAAKEAHPDLLIANNTKQDPANEDLNLHFGNREEGKPYIDSESTPDTTTPGGYWGAFSKETHQSDPSFHNYSRIGRYTVEMKEEQIKKTLHEVHRYNGILLASTWIQCGPSEGIHGPFTAPGGHSDLGSGKDGDTAWNWEIDVLHPDAGIRWWLEFIRDTYGPWKGSISGSD